MSLCFLGRGYISRGRVKFFEILRGVAHKGRGPDGFRVFLGGGERGQGKKAVRSMFQGGTDTLEYTMFYEQIYSNVSKINKKYQTIWFLRLSRIWNILTSLFYSLLNYKLRQNIWNKKEKSSKIGQYKGSLISTFPFFLTRKFY